MSIALVNPGPLYIATLQTPDTDITGQTAFLDTTPTFLLHRSNANKRCKIEYFILSQSGTVAGSFIRIIAGFGTNDMFSALGSGAAIPFRAASSGDQSEPETKFKFNVTCLAPTGKKPFLYNRTATATLGIQTLVLPDDSVSTDEDELIIDRTGSLAIWTFADTTGPSWKLEVGIREGT